MNSQFPEFKNELEKISVPVEKLDKMIENTIKENRVKRSRKKIAFYSFSAAVVGFGLFIGSAMLSPAMAKVASHIPLVGTFFNDSADEGLSIAGQKGLTQVIDQSSKDNGITLTMNEIFYDGTRLTLGYTQESLFAIGDLERPTIEVNGKEINFSSGYSGEFITPKKYKGTIDITPTEELPEEFEMKMRIDAVGLIPGKWAFDFPVKQSNEVTVIRPMDVKMIDGAELQLASLKLGPAGTNLKFNVTVDEKSDFDPYMLNFYILDEKENVYDFVGSSGNGETENGIEKANLDYLYAPLKEGTKKVKVIPYIIPMVEDGYEEYSVSLDGQSLPFTMVQNEEEKVKVTDIQHKNDRVIVYFEVLSDAIIDNHASRNSIWLEDASGENLISKDKPLAERLEGNRFKQEFSTKNMKGLKLKTFNQPKPIMYEAFEIDLP
ncbi:DUF4179 domain-containing protein [Cytobacillus dafuensis]|uniref:DUF4179 domain-containing protein n=1 Tax=Cytobacillus dafuensis TaxID=1742359 RepID=A0A5B8Z1J5_CYTDA|nr:DUF4179 domain-containing protein [Cytobacillus dafuensis]QED46647.1 DUF4179 domain-containing protein [Cytobacillus dafuensis]